MQTQPDSTGVYTVALGRRAGDEGITRKGDMLPLWHLFIELAVLTQRLYRPSRRFKILGGDRKSFKSQICSIKQHQKECHRRSVSWVSGFNSIYSDG